MLKRKFFIYGFFVATLLMVPFVVNGQFYNGMQMTFGKNRLQYNKFYWQYYRFDRFDVYFSEFGKDLALYTQWYANQEIKRIETDLDFTLDRRILFLVYNRLTDFRQSNLGLLTGNEEYNTGGVTRITNNRVSLYYDGDHKKFDQQISSGIIEVIINQMLYVSDFGNNITNSALISLPEWYTKGLISYMAENWSVEIDDKVKDGILSGKYKNFNRLTGNDAIYAGHSFWRYIERTYGSAVISNIIYMTRVNKSAKTAFLNVLGISIKDMLKEWMAYYEKKYQPYKGLTDDGGQVLLKRPKKTQVYEHIRVSPDGAHIAYVTNEMGQYRLWIFDQQKGKNKCILKREHKLDQIPDYTFPVLAWHPSGKILTYISEEDGGLKLTHYNVETKEKSTRNFLYLEKVLDFSYAPDGGRLVMSAVHNGKTDIYVHTLASSTNEQITDDLADDLNPHFIDNARKIIFSSNRTSDSLVVDKEDITALSPVFKLYISSYPQNGKKLILVSNDDQMNQTHPFEVSNNRFVYLGDNNGIINRYLADYDSTISYIDTTVHYRYFTKSFPISNQPRNILEQDVDRKTFKLGQAFFRDGRFYLYKNELDNSPALLNLAQTDYRAELLKQKRKDDSLSVVRKKNVEINSISKTIGKQRLDSIPSDEVDINHYVFEIEKLNLNDNQEVAFQNKQTGESSSNKLNASPKIRIYQTAFYANYLVSQVDFNYLNASYQPFTGGAVYYNPGFNLQFKIGANDLFEDYKMIGAARFSLDFQSNEYLLSFENLKKRLDWQMVFHRQAYKDLNDSGFYFKTTSQEGYFIVKYPFSQVLSVRATSSMRYDRVTTLAVEGPNTMFESLDMPTKNKIWGGLKLELIFDNTRSLGINVLSGTRYKIFGEAYKQIFQEKSDLFVLGADFRHYQDIHRNLIWASRIACSSSFGRSRLVYYLGGVDNWINFSNRVSTFDNSIRIDQNANYAYQTLATNMRGFSQNIRNGNNFMVINNEIRWPFIKYFANYPISSTFWNSMQIIGFFDAGSAWTGLSPYSHKNAYGSDVITNSSVKITLESNRSPIVYGYGFGLRAQLLGYFMRFDWAWGIENNVILPQIFYFSLSQDF